MLSNRLILALLLMAGSAHGAELSAEQRCAVQLQAEQMRIERDFARDRPPAGDKVAHERWAKNLHVALNAAGRAAETCERQSKPPMPPERRATLDDCIQRVAAKTEEVSRRYGGRTQSNEEQARQRAELQALHEQRIACDLASRK
jgi:Tfp pilus assembly protein PilV